MKYLFIIITFVLFYSCSNNRNVYWCGDHACVDAKEKKEYFKKNMVIEIQKSNKKRKKKLSQVEMIKEKSGLNNVNSKKNNKEEKLLAKKIEIEEKRKLKEEKKAIKRKLIEERKRLKVEKKMAKKTKSKKKNQKNTVKIKKTADKKFTNAPSSEFNALVQKILKKNKSKPYPDINSISIE